MPDLTPRVQEAGDRLIQFGYTRKTAARRRVTFARAFHDPPTVVVTPFWEESGREVGHTETIDSVTRAGFVVYSNNAAANYYISWIAVGYAGAGLHSDNVNYLQIGDLILEMGKTRKTRGASLTVPLRYPYFAQPPNIQVSPFWEGQRSGVGHVETIGRVAQREFDVLSDNHASNYFVSWIAAGTHRADLAPREPVPGWFVHDFPVGRRLVRTIRGRMQDGSPNRNTIGLGVPPFASPPKVVVTPFWEGQGRGVTHPETLDTVEPHVVRLTAGNGADNYFVSMLAIGRRA